MTCSNCTDHRTYITEDVDSALKLHCTKWSREILLVTLRYCNVPALKASAGPARSWAHFGAEAYPTEELEMLPHHQGVPEMFLVCTWKALSLHLSEGNTLPLLIYFEQSLWEKISHVSVPHRPSLEGFPKGFIPNLMCRHQHYRVYVWFISAFLCT